MSTDPHLSSYSLPINDHDDLQKVAQQHQWCSVAQLHLLNQYKKNNTPGLEERAAKTALFFTNTNWLSWQLHLLSNENTGEITDNKFEDIEQDHQNEKIKNSLSNTSAQQETSGESIAFEPLHTVDYFASQGIKITEGPIANDKLGKQMKSFTEWLKSMKKIHQENLQGDEQTDKKIQHIAEVSNTDADIVTEAMGDVLIKQNKNEKAIEVYHKLSLLNPAKSAYFAGKIQSIKTP